MKCVHARTVYTGRAVVTDAYVAFTGKQIAGVSRRPRGELFGRFDTVTPAFIDPHSHIGMHRAGEPSGESEANDHSDGILALPDALDSVQMDDVSFADAVEMGALYSCVVPGSGNIIGGLSAVIRNYGSDTTGALIARAGVKGAFGYNPMSTKSWKGARATTRMGSIALLRKALLETQDKTRRHRKARGRKRDEIVFTPEEQVLRELLGGRQRLRAHVHKIDDVAALLRLVDEFKLRATVEHVMDIHQPGIYAELKKRRIPVTYGPVDAFAYKVELKHANWRNIRHLVESRVQYGLMTDHPVTPARQLFLSARWFTRAGLGKQQAVELVSRRNAELLGIDDVLGTLARGKWASMACWNGDPFDVTSYPTAVFGEGELLYSE